MIRVPPALIFLVFAWLCANRPQGIMAEVVQWWSSAGTFSHQAQLAGELRAVLAPAVPSDPDAKRTAGATAEQGAARAAPSPAVGAPVSFQKSEFALPEAVRLLPPAAERWRFVNVSGIAAAQPREVPVPVPRMAIVLS